MSDELPASEASRRRKTYPDFFRTPWGAIAAAIVGLVAYLVGGQIVPAVIAIVAIMAEHGTVEVAELEPLIAPYVPLIVLFGTLTSLIMIGALRFFGWLAPAPKGGRGRLDTGLTIGFAAAACVLGQYVINWLLTLSGVVPEEQTLILAAAEAGGVFFFLSITVLAPIGEELFFRRFLFSTLRAGTGRFVAYAVSMLAFGLIHMNPTSLPLYLWIALCATLAYERTGTVWAAIAVHAANNSLGALFWEM